MFHRLLPDKAGDKRFYPPEADLQTHSADGLLRVKLRILSAQLGSPLYPQEQTSPAGPVRSEKCQGRTSCPRLGPPSSCKEKWSYSIGIISERRGIPSAWDRWPLLCMSSTK